MSNVLFPERNVADAEKEFIFGRWKLVAIDAEAAVAFVVVVVAAVAPIAALDVANAT